MTRRLSDWSKPGEKPPMVGVWETSYRNGWSSPTYQYWDGEKWKCASASVHRAFRFRDNRSFCVQSTVRFRGLATKPESE